MNKLFKIFKIKSNPLHAYSRHNKIPCSKTFFKAMAFLFSLVLLLLLFALPGCRQGFASDGNSGQGLAQSGKNTAQEEQIVENNSAISKVEANDTNANEQAGKEPVSIETAIEEPGSKDTAGSESGENGITETSSETEKENAPEGEELKILPAPPAINLHVTIGPEYAQDNQVCFYRVMADVSGEPFPAISFSKDDSIGAWGPNIAQVNLTKNESYTLKCEASNSQGTAAAEITLAWVDNPAGQQISDGGQLAPEILVDYNDFTNFLVDVNLTVQQVTILYKDSIIKTMPCSGGKPETPTPLGVYTTNQKIYYAWIPKFAQGAFYWTRFYGPYLFHSVPYDSNGNMMIEELNKMGAPASHGCIRLLLEDAKWFYETLPLGIRVSIHN